MTLRSSDLQSDSDQDSICNSCDVFSHLVIWFENYIFCKKKFQCVSIIFQLKHIQPIWGRIFGGSAKPMNISPSNSLHILPSICNSLLNNFHKTEVFAEVMKWPYVLSFKTRILFQMSTSSTGWGCRASTTARRWSRPGETVLLHKKSTNMIIIWQNDATWTEQMILT